MLRILTASTLALAVAAPSFAASTAVSEAAASDMEDPIIMDEKWDFSVTQLDLLSTEPVGYKKIDAGTIAASDVRCAAENLCPVLLHGGLHHHDCEVGALRDDRGDRARAADR